jgi:hypothetical protein
MPIKGEREFLKWCYEEVRKQSKFASLADRALELALGVENTQGHIKQAVGAVQLFLRKFPSHRATIGASSPLKPYNLAANVRACRDWKDFLRGKSGKYGPRRQYDWDVLKRYLTPKYGGTRRGGGGGDNEFEIVLRLVAEFLIKSS